MILFQKRHFAVRMAAAALLVMLATGSGAARAQDGPPPPPPDEIGTEAAGEDYRSPQGISALADPAHLLYTDPQFGFEVAFPADWTTDGGQLVDPYTYVWEVRFTAPGSLLQTVSISVQPLDDPALSAADWAAQVLASQGLSLPDLPSQTLDLNGAPALLVELPAEVVPTYNMAVRAAYLTAGGFGYTLAAIVEHGAEPADFAVFDALLATFRAGSRAPSLAPLPRDTVAAAATATDFQYPLVNKNWFVNFDVPPSVNYGVWSTCLQAYWQDMWHAGEDWGVPAYEPVYAVANGVVTWYNPSYTTYPGRVVITEHAVYDGTTVYSVYSHLATSNVFEGQVVSMGDLIGTIYDWGGNSHLHWEMRNFRDGTNLCNYGVSVVAGPGYTYPDHPQTKGYTDPTTYIDTHHSGLCAPPPLVSPDDGTLLHDRTVELNWTKPPCLGITGYALRITRKPDPDSAAVFTKTVSGSKYTYTFASDGIYYWHIAAIANGEQGFWATRRVVLSTDPAAVGPLVVARSRVDDNMLYDSSGDDDGIIDCGETIELYATLGNTGSSPAAGVIAALGSADPYVSQFANTSSAYPDIDVGSTASNDNDFDFDVAPDMPDGHMVQFNVDVTSVYGGPWSDSFSLMAACIPGTERLRSGTLEADSNSDGVPDGWKVTTAGGSKLVCNKPSKDKYVSHALSCAFQFRGTGSKEKLLQTYTPSGGGRAGDAFTLIVYAQGRDIPAGATARVKVSVANSDGTAQKETFALPTGDYEYQRILNTFTAAQDYDKIKVSVEYIATEGKLTVDNVSLVQSAGG